MPPSSVLFPTLLVCSIICCLYPLLLSSPYPTYARSAISRELESFVTQKVNFTALYPPEEPLPNPEMSDGYNTFSACLLVMDDNHRLIEWLAYHYHVLPLRYLIVAVDPRSKTSPTSILNRWREQGMYILEWTDQDFWKKKSPLRDIPDDAELQVKRDRHRGRQKYFYRQCLIHMKEDNRTWVALHDSDEYIVYNHAGGDKFQEWEAKMIERHSRSSHNKETRIEPSKTPPTTAEEGAMIKYIRQEQAAGLKFYQSPCIGIPRLSFSAVDTGTPITKGLAPGISSSFDLEQFDTLRWRRHAPRNDFVKNALGKVMIDVSRVDMKNTPAFRSLHRPIQSLCPAPWHNDWDSGLRINHYLGSWESYSFRDDARRGYERSREQWEYKSSSNAVQDDDNISPWLNGFVESQGLPKAANLLHNIGLPRYYRNEKDHKWDLLPDKLAKILETDVTIANDNKMVAFDAFVREKYRNTKLRG